MNNLTDASLTKQQCEKKWKLSCCLLPLCAMLCVLAAMLAVAAFTGLWPMDENPYNSYAIQADAWLHGHLDIPDGAQYTWLELAIREGKYYVSFPPFPSFVLLPFAAVLGTHTPDHLLMWAVTALGVLMALRLSRKRCGSEALRLQWVLFLFLGNGYLFIAMRGSVWFMAQAMCFVLSLAALVLAREGHGAVSLVCWACAVGCRPMQALYLPVLLRILCCTGKNENSRLSVADLLRTRWRWLLAPAVIGLVYMALNALRFGNPLEFGHSFLPEFTRAEAGQFSLSYAPHNAMSYLRLPQTGGEGGALRFYKYEGMAFYLTNPLLLMYAAVWLRTLVRAKQGARLRLLLLPALLALHGAIICCHRTLGGWQFGNRYLLDMLPFVYDELLDLRAGGTSDTWLAPLATWGMALHLLGTAAVYNAWI